MYTKKTFITSSLIAISFILFFCEKQKKRINDIAISDEVINVFFVYILFIKDI